MASLIIVLCLVPLILNLPSAIGFQVKLVDEGDECSGRVVVDYKGEKGTVCDDLWDLRDADVVCRQLGCDYAISTSSYEPGFRPIILGDFQCVGNEATLSQCSYREIKQQNCTSNKVAGVLCTGFSVRLVDGRDACSGRVVVDYKGGSGTVCDDLLDSRDANVVCRQLGCGSSTSIDLFEPGFRPFLLVRFQCKGSEATLSQCSYREIKQHNCTSNKVAGVTCSGSQMYTTTTTTTTTAATTTTTTTAGFHFILVGGEEECSGRVVVNYKRETGTVCYDFWDIRDAEVFCRELECGYAISTSSYEPDFGPFILGRFKCDGSEATLSQCSYREIKQQKCASNKDAGVICSGPQMSTTTPTPTPTTVFQVMLEDGGCACSGRVVVGYKGESGTVCDDFWNIYDANVVCRQQGCGSAISAPSFKPGIRPIILGHFQCEGYEATLSQCSYREIKQQNCASNKDAGVICSGPQMSTTTTTTTTTEGTSPPDTPPPNAGESCGAVLTNSSGLISKEFYPHPNTWYTWTIRGASSDYVELRINYVWMGNPSTCGANAVAIYDGFPWDGKPIGRICTDTDMIFRSTSNVLTIQYHTENTDSLYSFEAQYDQRKAA